ncbi:UDP-N-acetylglucosamine 2-epimerase (non-hydrolyzing) [Cytophagaceae bacterium YF14B1]|uniref:UDP-N-acetylglucosamine 2-epimerase (Non-hydrolyzing) n=1 Tax=Xanthocytophaga flava TaxID=3048013 RepID=A0AAE3QQF2_9BACT|nr:UDP-N-acetylglucosamine 2-epimerase (non-hydrolyzing) [Xanthocytophaga flavus]MDJ1480984.1 UDP-N-acetylglucosamine 2-epimerase (non-hydrolyzing) [Xanthocytophaga flavus]
MQKKLLTVVGTRPNIIKITQFDKVVQQYPRLTHKLLHTGQHYNHNMSDVFFEELHLAQPQYRIQAETTTVITQMAQIMQGIEGVVREYKPDMLLVVGDVTSTLAAALVANKTNTPLAHIESGLRSNDREMPEEINRILTDAITDLFFVTEQSGLDNLLAEKKSPESIHLVGNTMIDTLVAYDADIQQSKILAKLEIQPQHYALMTMHRPGNVDTLSGLEQLLDIITELTRELKIIFPIHPRTLNRLKEFNLYDQVETNPNLILSDPVGYLDFQKLILHARYVITDSGGIQEETTFRKVPCITLRPNTERPSTIDLGSNTLLHFDKEKILTTVNQINTGSYKTCGIPPLWDGKATERIFSLLDKFLN